MMATEAVGNLTAEDVAMPKAANALPSTPTNRPAYLMDHKSYEKLM